MGRLSGGQSSKGYSRKKVDRSDEAGATAIVPLNLGRQRRQLSSNSNINFVPVTIYISSIRPDILLSQGVLWVASRCSTNHVTIHCRPSLPSMSHISAKDPSQTTPPYLIQQPSRAVPIYGHAFEDGTIFLACSFLPWARPSKRVTLNFRPIPSLKSSVSTVS